jgi:hypothetical protein
LPVERQMIAIFGDQHMGDQSRAGAAALDRQRRHRRLRDRFADPAAQLGPDMDDHREVRGHVFQHLAAVFADLSQRRAAAGGANPGRLMDQVVARQMIGQRSAAGDGARGFAAASGRFDTGFGRPRRRCGVAFLEIAEQQLQLPEVAVELFRGTAKAGPPQRRQLRLQLLDVQGLGIDLCLQQRRESAQRVGIAGQSRGRQSHGPA